MEGPELIKGFEDLMPLKLKGEYDQLGKHFIYDVWNINTITNKIRHPGNIPQEFIENLLYYYTEEGDLIYDPFGGGGPTIDMCSKWRRKYYVTDLAPIKERPEIKKWNLEDGLPDDLIDPKLTFLDPPYFAKKKMIMLMNLYHQWIKILTWVFLTLSLKICIRNTNQIHMSLF